MSGDGGQAPGRLVLTEALRVAEPPEPAAEAEAATEADVPEHAEMAHEAPPEIGAQDRTVEPLHLTKGVE